MNFTELFNDILKQYTKNYYQIRVKTTDLGSVYEVQYKVNILPDMDEKEFMDRIRERNGNLTVMLCAAESEHS